MPVSEADVALLEDLDEEAQEVEAAETEGGDLQDIPSTGNFQVEISEPGNSGFLNTDSDGAMRARVVMRVVNDPEVEGATDTKSWRITDQEGNLDEQSLSYLKSDLATMGIEFTKLSEIDELLAQAEGTILNIGRKENGDYVNTYFNDMVEAGVAYEEAGY